MAEMTSEIPELPQVIRDAVNTDNLVVFIGIMNKGIFLTELDEARYLGLSDDGPLILSPQEWAERCSNGLGRSLINQDKSKSKSQSLEREDYGFESGDRIFTVETDFDEDLIPDFKVNFNPDNKMLLYSRPSFMSLPSIYPHSLFGKLGMGLENESTISIKSNFHSSNRSNTEGSPQSNIISFCNRVDISKLRGIPHVEEAIRTRFVIRDYETKWRQPTDSF